MKNRVENENQNYKNKIEEIVKSFSETLTFAFETLNMNFDVSSTFDTKKLLAIGSGLIGVAAAVCFAIPGFQIAAVFLTFVSVLGAFLSGLFGNKEKKIREAQEKLYGSIKDSFEKQRGDNIKKIINDFKGITQKTEKSIERMFQVMDDELEKLINELMPLCELTGLYEDKLNKIYAIRIMNFACRKNFDINDSSLYSKIKVIHDFAKKIVIKTDLVWRINTEKLKLILQEDVVFTRFNK